MAARSWSTVVTVPGDPTYLETVVTDPNDLTYAFAQGNTITFSPELLTRALDDGENVSIQANDDITIDSPITESASSNAGTLTLDAGRSILINTSISTAGGNLSLVAQRYGGRRRHQQRARPRRTPTSR